MIADRQVKFLFALTLGYLATSASVGLSQPPREFTTFAWWCENLSKLSAGEKHTVEVLLEKAETRECQAADRSLARLDSLDLGGNQLADLKPLSTLTDLKRLALNSNQIADIKSLSNLTNLTELYLNDNQIVDIEPVSNLIGLKHLELNYNQIADIKPLSNLTGVTSLDLGNNPIADRTCPL